jgi:aminotransferase class V
MSAKTDETTAVRGQPDRHVTRSWASWRMPRGALFHTDACQSVGKIPVDVAELGVDLLTIAGHKMYAPKGVGALFVHTGLELEPTIYGGGEGGRRSGTENVALIVALGEAARLAAGDVTGRAGRQRLRDLLHHRLARVAARPGAPQRSPHRPAAQHAQPRHPRHHRAGAPGRRARPGRPPPDRPEAASLLVSRVAHAVRP